MHFTNLIPSFSVKIARNTYLPRKKDGHYIETPILFVFAVVPFVRVFQIFRLNAYGSERLFL